MECSGGKIIQRVVVREMVIVGRTVIMTLFCIF